MTELFDEKYRIKSSRLSERDYSQPGSYFITICTQGQKSYFGEVIDGDVELNDIGKIVQDIWSNIPNHFENVKLDIGLIMPNHVHGIITIHESNSVETHDCVSPPNNETRHENGNETHHENGNETHHENGNETHHENGNETRHENGNETRHENGNETRHGMSLRRTNKFGTRNKNSLSLIINQFKGSVTREIRKYIPTFKRQANYYEHVVRNEKDMERIRTYIINNPYKRRNDEHYR